MTDERRPDIDELISLVEVPGPLPDGAEDALWGSTAEFYERLTSSPRPDSQEEILMLAPERNEPAHRKRTWLLAAAAALVAVLVVGLAFFLPGSDDEPEPVVTQVPTTSLAPSAPETGYRGIVWESDVDPTRVNATEGRPGLVAGPLDMRVDSLVITPGPDQSPFCANAVEEGATDVGGNEQELPEITSCLIVEWRYDVGDEATSSGFVGAQPGVTRDGEEIVLLMDDCELELLESSATDCAVFGNLGPGSSVSLLYDVQSEADGFLFDRWEFEVPDTLQPIDWFDDAG